MDTNATRIGRADAGMTPAAPAIHAGDSKNGVSNAFFILDTNADLTYISPEAAAALGWAVSELLNENFFYYVHPDELFPIIHIVLDLLFDDVATASLAWSFQTREGSWRTIGANVHSRPHAASDGDRDLTFYLTRVRDIPPMGAHFTEIADGHAE